MAKKDKTVTVPNPHNIQNRDVLQRLNFLYQASVYLQSISPSTVGDSLPTGPSNSVSASHPAVKKKKHSKFLHIQKEEKLPRRRTRIVSTNDVARGYVRTMKQVAQKATVKMDPTVKRTLCKGCDAVLVPGLSASVRVQRTCTYPFVPIPSHTSLISSASRSHGQLVTTTCHNCHSARRIPAPPVPVDDDMDVAMALDGEASDSDPKKSKKNKKGKTVAARLPPLFERDVGHVVFRGNEQILPAQGGPSGAEA
ncbi:RNAse P Rpr2/Rpp21/SNM1 subunit domain-containing protein [Amylostereum chailletii]|nr:RNAse P Rpr2/Rpp21/SNM1 subunit domain-containing protein [Amylostereum chailletii]